MKGRTGAAELLLLMVRSCTRHANELGQSAQHKQCANAQQFGSPVEAAT